MYCFSISVAVLGAMPIKARAEHFSHDADIGICGSGPTREAAFEQAALALSAIVIDVSTIQPKVKIHIECEAPRDDLLLVDWLNAVIFRMAVDHLLFCKYRVAIDDHRLSADAWGEEIDRARHVLGVEPKGATYTALKVAREADQVWTAQCVIDV